MPNRKTRVIVNQGIPFSDCTVYIQQLLDGEWKTTYTYKVDNIFSHKILELAQYTPFKAWGYTKKVAKGWSKTS